jgi:hypothetical protein
MDPTTQQQALAAAGAASAEPVYVDDVFSIDVWDGNSSTRSINNGIDLSGEGGMVWFMNRFYGNNKPIYDTARGVNKFLKGDNGDPEVTSVTNGLTAFNSNGFTLGSNPYVNGNSYEYASWTFRKAPKFFDIVTYSGNSYNQTINHNLGSVPGMILIKEINADGSGYWLAYHRSVGATKSIYWSFGGAVNDVFDFMRDTEPTSTQFTLGDGNNVNQSGKNYVAYLFAHDEAEFGEDSDESIIKCGSYTGNGSSQEINIGFEPQFFMWRDGERPGSGSGTNPFHVADDVRGFAGRHGDIRSISAGSGTEQNYGGTMTRTPNGIFLHDGDSKINQNNRQYFYVAIRRPHKPFVETASDVFAVNRETESRSSTWTSLSGFKTDMIWNHTADQNTNWNVSQRLTNGILSTHRTDTEQNSDYFGLDTMNGVKNGSLSLNSQTRTHVDYHFKRAKGFFDMCLYTGNGNNNHNISHSLGVTPEMIMVKARDGSLGWSVWHKDNGNGSAGGKSVRLNETIGASNHGHFQNNGGATSTHFGLNSYGFTNGTNVKYVAFLFATLSGISKVGSYTGTGNNINVDCGFTAGARFVIIKRIDQDGQDWFVYDSASGIVSGNDPYHLLNSSNMQVTNTDYIDPLNSGFTITSSAPADLNSANATYIFYAIA